MYRFEREQQIFDVAGTKIGGQPGEYPTVLAGTVFYEGHEILKDGKKGVFDKKQAEKLIQQQTDAATETGNPALIQIYGHSKTSIQKFIDFVADVSDAPFLIDSTEAMVRAAGATYVSEVGLADRAIYNSINMGITKDEAEALKDAGIDTAVLVAYNPTDNSLRGRIEILENGADVLDNGLLEIGEEVGVSQPLLDPAVTPIGGGGGIAIRTALAMKAKWGYPVGSGVHNAPSSWGWLQKKRGKASNIYQVCDVGANVLQQALGADFLLYGPIEYALTIFPLTAMVDILIAEAGEELGTKPVENHPIHRLL